jgi:hypothetical protein
VTLCAARLADDHDHQMLPSPCISVQRKNGLAFSEPGAPSNQVGHGERFRELLPVRWKKIGMSFNDVTFPLLGQFDLGVQIGARKPPHEGSSVANRLRQASTIGVHKPSS